MDSSLHPRKVRRPSARGRALILTACVFLYSVACALPALHLSGRRDVWSGVEVMVIGPLGLRLGQFGWLANIAALIALRCVMTGRTRFTMIFTAIAMALALHAPFLIGREIALGDEPFNTVRVISLGSGYYVWVAALLLPLVFALLSRRPRPKSRTTWEGDERKLN